MFRNSERPHQAVIFRAYFDETYTEIIKQACKHPTYTIKMWPNWTNYRSKPKVDTEWVLDTDEVYEVVCWINTLFDMFMECQTTHKRQADGNSTNYFKIMYKEIS